LPHRASKITLRCYFHSQTTSWGHQRTSTLSPASPPRQNGRPRSLPYIKCTCLTYLSLNAQHKQLISCIGYTLHPSIVATLPTAPKVAELATGTGAFIIDLAKELSPDAQLDGTDYSDAALPCQGQLPSNVRLGVADAKQAPPEESTGKYDVVCIRYINPAMMPEDWAKVAAHAAALLKPGGALQFAGMGRSESHFT